MKHMKHMKHMKRSALVAMALVAGLIGGTPVDAASATTVAVQGRISIGNGLQSIAGLSVGGTCVDASAGSQPTATAGSCNLITTGTAQGTNCSLWSGTVEGSVWPVLNVVGAPPQIPVKLSVTMAGSVVTITGTSGSRRVAGSGVAIVNNGTACASNPNLAATYTWVGSLTISG